MLASLCMNRVQTWPCIALTHDPKDTETRPEEVAQVNQLVDGEETWPAGWAL